MHLFSASARLVYVATQRAAPMADTGSGASDRAAALAAAREKERAATDAKRAALAATASAAASRVLTSNFAGAESAGAAAEAFLRERTIGLLTREEYAAARDEAKAKEVELRIQGAPAAAPGGGAQRSWGGGARAAAAGAASAAAAAAAAAAASSSSAPPVAGHKRSSRALLSFGAEEEEEEEEGQQQHQPQQPQQQPQAEEAGHAGADDGNKRPCAAPAAAAPAPALGKDPGVPTAFLPDAAREAREAAARAAAEAEWAALQEQAKAQPLKVVYSYWDGTGHRRELSIPQGASIGRFLEAARGDLAKEFPELRTASASSLLYVKEDLIIPQHHTFYELISTQARGKSGPLFAFGVVEDLRLGALDARVEKEDSHPGKILDARWYQRNKHIFPYSRWEVYQPGVARGKYTIG